MAFKSEKQRRWMHLHHPEVANDWEKKYKDGGFVEDSKKANKMGDIVNAKLAVGEIILNGKQIEKVEEETGVPAEQFWAKIGVPGFEGGKNPMRAKGGGVATKKDYLMKYKDGGISPQDISGMIEKKTGSTDYDEQQQMLGNMRKHGDPGAFTITPTEVENLYQSNPLAQQNFAADMARLDKEKSGGFFQNLFAGKKKNTDLYTSKADGGVAKKEHLMGYQDGGVGTDDTGYQIRKHGRTMHEDVPGLKGFLQRMVPGGRSGLSSRDLTTGEKGEIWDWEAGKGLSKSNPYYDYLTKSTDERPDIEGIINQPPIRKARGGVAKKKKKKKKRGY
jgi:hypothetical protein